jgi:hypothetical protein
MATIDIIADRSTGTAVAGKAYFETSTNQFIVYTGTAWINIDSDGTGAFFENLWGAGFDGNNDCLATYDLQKGGSSAFTSSTDDVSMSGWVKLNSFLNDAGLFGFGRTQNGAAMNSGSVANIATYTNGSIYMHINGSAFNVPGTLNTGEWYHIAFTHNSTSGAGIVYLNGNQVHTYTKVGNGYHTNLSAYIGVGRWAYAFSDADIDDVAIWNSVLSPSDITSIYNSGVPSDLAPLNPVGYWRMGDHSNDSATSSGNIATITDSSGNGNDAIQATASKQPSFAALDPLSRNYLQFDGSYQYLKGTPTSSTDVYGVSAFVFLDSDITPTTSPAVISSVSNNAIFGLGGDIAGAVPNEIIIVYPAAAYAYADPNGSIPRGWHHLMMAWSPTSQTNSGSPGYDIYLDGNIVGNVINTQWGSPGLITMASNMPFYLGSRGGGAYMWSGLVDEVAVFGTQLTSSDITSIYNNGVPGDISALNPAAWWRMGDDDSFVPGGVVSQVTDHSGNGIHLEQITNYMKPIAGASNSIYKES